MPAESWAHELGPTETSEIAGEELALATQLFGFGVHVVHKLIYQCDGDLFDLAFRIRHLADEDVSGSIDASLGIGIEHWIS